MLSLFIVNGHVYMCIRNIDVVSVLCEWSCIYVSGISMLSLFLVSGHAYVCQEYRCCLCSLWVVKYMCVRNIDVVSVPCEWSCICVSGISMLSLFLVSGHVYVCQEYRCCLCSLWVVMHMCVRNIDVVSVPCEWSSVCVSGISMLSLFLVSGHVYVCQEYLCCLCSLWVVMYMCVRNIDVISVPYEWSCISLSGISM